MRRLTSRKVPGMPQDESTACRRSGQICLVWVESSQQNVNVKLSAGCGLYEAFRWLFILSRKICRLGVGYEVGKKPKSCFHEVMLETFARKGATRILQAE